MRPLSILALVAALSLPASRLAGQEAMKRNVPDSLVSKARITEDSARAVALKRVPGTVQSVELERKRGRLVYEFDIKRNGRQGVTMVDVNAMNGRVTAVAREGAKGRRATQRSS